MHQVTSSQPSPPQTSPPLPTCPRPLLLDPTTRSTLQTQHSLLHLLHARNRNQHRRSSWYRHFSTFRREVRRLCDALAIEAATRPRAHSPASAARRTGASKRSTSAPSKKTQKLPDAPPTKKEEKRLRTAATARLHFWAQSDILSKWHAAFGSLVADPQFAPLGCVLLGVLGRVARVTAMTAWVEGVAEVLEAEERDRGEEEVREVLGRFGEEEDGIGADIGGSVMDGEGARTGMGMGLRDDDLGVVVKRQ